MMMADTAGMGPEATLEGASVGFNRFAHLVRSLASATAAADGADIPEPEKL